MLVYPTNKTLCGAHDTWSFVKRSSSRSHVQTRPYERMRPEISGVKSDDRTEHQRASRNRTAKRPFPRGPVDIQRPLSRTNSRLESIAARCPFLRSRNTSTTESKRHCTRSRRHQTMVVGAENNGSRIRRHDRAYRRARS